MTRKSVKLFCNQENTFRTQKSEEESRIFRAALENADENVLKNLGLDLGSTLAGRSSKCLETYERNTH
jgi:hypothetical protein